MPKPLRLGKKRAPLNCEPDLSAAHKAAIVRAVRWAWVEVTERWPEVVQTGREEELTERLQRVLNEQEANSKRRAPGLASFETVGRGSKVTTADGRIEKAPDLVFRPSVAIGVRNLSDWGWFVECKIIAAEAHHSPLEYCNNGVARFVNAEYAARMPTAAVIAYVRDGRQPYASLQRHLVGRHSTRSHTVGATPATCESAHDRGVLSPPCVDISLLHLWLDAQNVA